jgi:hypothetical protein
VAAGAGRRCRDRLGSGELDRFAGWLAAASPSWPSLPAA